ncbi:unnamed protein product, partial [Ilex paraguariensis]
METKSSKKHGVDLDGGSAHKEAVLGGSQGATLGGAHGKGAQAMPTQAAPGQVMADAQGDLGVGNSHTAPLGSSRRGMSRGDGAFGTIGMTSGIRKKTLVNLCSMVGRKNGVGELQRGSLKETGGTCHELGGAHCALGGAPIILGVVQASFNEASDGYIAQGAEFLLLDHGGDLVPWVVSRSGQSVSWIKRALE